MIKILKFLFDSAQGCKKSFTMNPPTRNDKMQEVYQTANEVTVLEDQERYCGPVSWLIGCFIFPCILFCESVFNSGIPDQVNDYIELRSCRSSSDYNYNDTAMQKVVEKLVDFCKTQIGPLISLFTLKTLLVTYIIIARFASSSNVIRDQFIA